MGALWGLFATSLLLGLSGAIAPGPLLTAVIGDVARTGFWAAPLLVLGHALLELLVVLALARGLARAIRRPTVLRTLAALGGITLLALGGDLVRAGWTGAVHLGEVRAAQASAWPVLTGVVVSVSNPYWVLWWATVGAGYTALALHRGTMGLGAFYAGHIMADFGWYVLIALLLIAGQRFLDAGVYRFIVGLAGAFLMAMGLFFIWAAIRWARSAPKIGATFLRKDRAPTR
ncbi:MAG: lysine transporter LysE [Dehalococcoidia bacterium]|nr:lysine transporter LysE [Dehalococcoidia bacterium]